MKSKEQSQSQVRTKLALAATLGAILTGNIVASDADAHRPGGVDAPGPIVNKTGGVGAPETGETAHHRSQEPAIGAEERLG